MANNDGTFQLSEACLEDMDELSDIYALCHENDDVWPALIGTMKPDDHRAWLTAQRIKGVRPGNTIAKITEIVTGYSLHHENQLRSLC